MTRRVCLDFHGWRKFEDVTNGVFRSGTVSIAIPEPLCLLSREAGREAALKVAPVISFYAKGRFIDEYTPIFEADA